MARVAGEMGIFQTTVSPPLARRRRRRRSAKAEKLLYSAA